MDISAMFRGAVEEFDARVRQIGDHQWQAATPDEDWAVRDLVNHVVGEDLWAPPLLAGSTIAEVGDRSTATCSARSQGRLDRRIGRGGAGGRGARRDGPDRPPVIRRFPGPGLHAAAVADHLIHAWDLARAIGADERLDAGLVASCGTWFDAMEDAYRSAGAIAPGRRCPATGTPRPCCWRVSGAVPGVDRETGVGYDVIVAGGGSAGLRLRGRGPAQRGRALPRAARGRAGLLGGQRPSG